MALIGASLLIGSVGLDLIYFTNLQKKLLGSAEMATFSLVVLSLVSDRVQGVWDPVNWHVPCRWLHGMSSSGNVILKWLCYSPVCSDDGNGLQCGDGDWSSWMGVVLYSRFSLLNSTVHFFTMSQCVPRSPWMLTPCDQSSGWLYDGPCCPLYWKVLMHNDYPLKPQSQLQ